jgi:hypothetical protein
MTVSIACGRRLVGRVEVPDTRDGFLPIHFNHLAVAAKDKQKSATFLTSLLGLPEPTAWGPFVSVTLDDGVRLDYAEPGIPFPVPRRRSLLDPVTRRRARIALSGPVRCGFHHGTTVPSQENSCAAGRRPVAVRVRRHPPPPRLGRLRPLPHVH